MSQFFACPYLNNRVELTEERRQHIRTTHPGTLPEYQEQLEATLQSPDQIRRSTRDHNALLFSRWFDTIRTGRHLVVVVVNDDNRLTRYWIVTVYTARRISGGAEVWQKET